MDGPFFPPPVFPHGSSFTSLRKTREGWVGEGRGGGGGGGGGGGRGCRVIFVPQRRPDQPGPKHRSFKKNAPDFLMLTG